MDSCLSNENIEAARSTALPVPEAQGLIAPSAIELTPARLPDFGLENTCKAVAQATPNVQSLPIRPARPRTFGCRGFSFTEVMFAVIILGVGFIMVAAIFPVAIQQSKTTFEEGTASATARSAAANLMRAMTAYYNPATDLQNSPPAATAMSAFTVPANESVAKGLLLSFGDDRWSNIAATPLPYIRDEMWERVAGNFIHPTDARIASIGFYKRDRTFTNTTLLNALSNAGPPTIVTSDANFAQVVVITVQVRNKTLFDAGKDLVRVGTRPANLEPKVVLIQLSEGGASGPDRVQFVNSSNSAVDQFAAAEGAYILISDDAVTGSPATYSGSMNGRTYRLGLKVAVGLWELVPGSDMAVSGVLNENLPPRAITLSESLPTTGVPATAYLVGKAYTDATDPDGVDNVANNADDYNGPAMDVAVYTTFVPVQ